MTKLYTNKQPIKIAVISRAIIRDTQVAFKRSGMYVRILGGTVSLNFSLFKMITYSRNLVS